MFLPDYINLMGATVKPAEAGERAITRHRKSGAHLTCHFASLPGFGDRRSVENSSREVSDRTFENPASQNLRPREGEELLRWAKPSPGSGEKRIGVYETGWQRPVPLTWGRQFIYLLRAAVRSALLDNRVSHRGRLGPAEGGSASSISRLSGRW